VKDLPVEQRRRKPPRLLLHHLGGARRSRCAVASWWLLLPLLPSATGEESAPSAWPKDRRGRGRRRLSREGAGDFTTGRDNEQSSSALPEVLDSSVGAGMAATACSWIRGTRRAAAGQEDLAIEDGAASGGMRDGKNKRNPRSTQEPTPRLTPPFHDSSLPCTVDPIKRHLTINHYIPLQWTP
jgi:hypothetical protein